MSQNDKRTVGGNEAEILAMSADLRRSAEIEDGRVLPPEVEIRGGPFVAVLDAVRAALDAEPNSLDEPVLTEGGDREHHVARLTARYNEIPHTADGELVGWLPPYRAREEFDAALREALPDDVAFEAQNSHTTVFYEEVSR